MQTLIDANPKLKIVSGASTNRVFNASQEISKTAKQLNKENIWYDSYNTALQMDSTSDIQLYHKSKLVPGVEKLPYPEVFKFLGPLAIDLGGTVGSVGSQEERSVFKYKPQAGISAAPVVCYESIYGDYVSEYVRNGASLIFIITNDGWWSDSPGYRQHLQYATLRAIETRRSIARSANTGVSAFINQKGEIVQRSKWWVQDALRGTIHANTALTFYTRTGEYIGTSALWLALMFFAITIVVSFVRSRKIKTA
jgi:apolipoprotein N-acyltransferase